MVKKTKKFNAEVGKILKLVINSIYTNKEKRPDQGWDWNNGYDNENLTWLL